MSSMNAHTRLTLTVDDLADSTPLRLTATDMTIIADALDAASRTNVHALALHVRLNDYLDCMGVPVIEPSDD